MPSLKVYDMSLIEQYGLVRKRKYVDVVYTSVYTMLFMAFNHFYNSILKYFSYTEHVKSIAILLS